jgi:hypothetical protein
MLRLGQVVPERIHLLEIVADPLGTQQVGVSINGHPLATFELRDATPDAGRTIVVPGRLLRSNSHNTITLGLSAPASTSTDDRQMAVALRRLRLSALPVNFGGLRFEDDEYFGEGFSAAESGWRWTDGARAHLSYPVGAVASGSDYVLEIQAFAHGRQRMEVLVNGESVGRDTLRGAGTVSRTFRLPGRLLGAERMNQVELRLPDARPAPNDSRNLGLAVVGIRLAPAPPS